MGEKAPPFPQVPFPAMRNLRAHWDALTAAPSEARCSSPKNAKTLAFFPPPKCKRPRESGAFLFWGRADSNRRRPKPGDLQSVKIYTLEQTIQHRRNIISWLSKFRLHCSALFYASFVWSSA